MQVSKNTIIDKMIHELETARVARTTEETAASMGHIKLLSELWLEEYKKQGSNVEHVSNITASAPPVAGKTTSQQTDLSKNQEQILASATKEINEENDDFSIFDF